MVFKTISSIVHLLHQRAEELPQARSYTFLAAGEESETLTFLQLDQRARAIGARLQQLKAKGERVLLLYPTGTEYIAALYGCLAGGSVAVPAYPPRMNRNIHRLEAILDDASPRVVLTTEAVSRQMRRELDESPKWRCLDWVVTNEVATCEADSWVDPQATGDTLAFLQYTSASTSNPKGVMVSHGNILHNQTLMKQAGQQDSETVIVSWLPLFHDMGLIGIVLASLYYGVPCYLMSPVDFLKRPKAWLEAITRYKGTYSGSPDFGFHLCVEKINPQNRTDLDLSSWKVAFNGSEPVRAETLRSFGEAFSSCGFRPEVMFPCYGLAEHTLFASGRYYRGSQSFSRTSLEEHRPRPAKGTSCIPLVSCGAPQLDTVLKIVDHHSACQCPDGEIGEIWLMSPSVAQGYWNRSEESAYVFQSRLLDGDGPYLRTGDLGFLWDGELHITGRLKDLIVMRGRNLMPQDIEQTVESCDPAIRPTFVAAIAVEAGGAERLVVVAEVRRGLHRIADADGLIDRIRSVVAAEYAVDVSAVTLVRPGSLPKTSSGKTQRAKIRRDFLDGELAVLVGADGALAQWRDESVLVESGKADRSFKAWGTQRVENWLLERIAAHTNRLPERIDRDAAIVSLGLDSVATVAIVCEIEEIFGVELDLDQLFGSGPTVRQISQWILSRPQTQTLVVKAAKKSVQNVSRARQRNHDSPEAQPRYETTSGPIALSREEPKRRELGRPILSVPGVSAREKELRRQHPFRTSVNPELGRALAQLAMDKTFVRGEGSWLWDETGRRYLDFLAQYGALPFGFNPSRIWAALDAVRDCGEPSFVQPSYLNAAGELAQRLLAVAPPGMSYATFANSGAEAVEAAIKLCISTTHRHDILSASNGFHGKTLGALSATDKDRYQKPFGAPVDGFDYVPYGDLASLRESLSTRRYAAFLVEPVQGEGGIVEPPSGYLRLARKACREAGTLFVADEIQTGLGRTGTMFVCCALGITPDVMTVAKALGGGLIPIGACLSTAAAYNKEFALNHTSTFAGNTLACRAGLATLDLLEEHDSALIKHVAENGARLKEGLLDLKRRYPGLIAEVRGRGFLLGLRFGLSRYCVEHGLLGYLGEQEAFTALIVSYMLHVGGIRLGYTLNQGGILRIEPPLTTTWEECLIVLQALEQTLLVLQRGDLAALTAPITGVHLSEKATAGKFPIAVVASETARRLANAQPGDGRFAFLVHPLAWNDYTDADRTLSELSEDQLGTLSSALADNFEPFVIGETRVLGKNGKAAYGEFILVPRRAEELKAMSHEEVSSEIRDAVLLAQKRGAKIVGLGGYTSVVTQGGVALKGIGMPPLTTGNSYTAIASRQTVRLAAAERGWSLSRRTVGVVGAGGAVGQAVSVLLARETGRLLLLGNPVHPQETRQRLLQVAGMIVWCGKELRTESGFAQGTVASWVAELDFVLPPKPDRARLMRLGEELINRTGSVLVSVDAKAMLPEADIVVCCTSTTERMVTCDCLRPSAVVCDISRPTNVDDEVLTRRPDVMVLDGGVVRLPCNSSLGLNTSLTAGHAYACMAETMMLAMDHRYDDISLGYDLPLERVLDIELLADELDFQVVLNQKERKDREGDEFSEDLATAVALV